MSKGTKIPSEWLRDRARDVVATLAPWCARIEIAGSIRRKVALVGDIEIVFQPRPSADMFGVVQESAGQVWMLCNRLVEQGFFCRATKAGDRYRQYPLRIGDATINLDLFAVLPPATWGVILAIRTGPADFSQRFVTAAHRKNRQVRDGAVYCVSTGQAIPTDTEEQAFDAVGLPWVWPRLRGSGRLIPVPGEP